LDCLISIATLNAEALFISLCIRYDWLNKPWWLGFHTYRFGLSFKCDKLILAANLFKRATVNWTVSNIFISKEYLICITNFYLIVIRSRRVIFKICLFAFNFLYQWSQALGSLDDIDNWIYLLFNKLCICLKTTFALQADLIIISKNNIVLCFKCLFRSKSFQRNIVLAICTLTIFIIKNAIVFDSTFTLNFVVIKWSNLIAFQSIFERICIGFLSVNWGDLILALSSLDHAEIIMVDDLVLRFALDADVFWISISNIIFECESPRCCCRYFYISTFIFIITSNGFQRALSNWTIRWFTIVKELGKCIIYFRFSLVYNLLC